jgi:hypothetical protein
MPKLGTLIEAAINAKSEKIRAVADLEEVTKQMKVDLQQHEQQLRLLKSSLLPNAQNREPVPLDFHQSTDKRESELVGILAGRFRDARDLCGHSVKVAAKLLGIARGDLLKIELGLDVGAPPLWLIKRTAEIYAVSGDYLLGLNDDWDVDDPEVRKERDFLVIMQCLHVESYSKVISEQIRQDNRLKALNTAVVAFGMAVQHIG